MLYYYIFSRIAGENLRSEPKYIVFLSKLLLLFNICPVCKEDKPLVETREVGTMVEVKVSCGNSDCTQRETTWTSQPNMTGTRMLAANFLLCFSILLSGCLASKVLQMFRNMVLSCISLRKYFKHQGVSEQSHSIQLGYQMNYNKRNRKKTFSG